MKSDWVQFRTEKAVKKYISQAAAFDRKSLSGFMLHAALAYANELRSKGWEAKPPPVPKDGRRKQQVAA